MTRSLQVLRDSIRFIVLFTAIISLIAINFVRDQSEIGQDQYQEVQLEAKHESAARMETSTMKEGASIQRLKKVPPPITTVTSETTPKPSNPIITSPPSHAPPTKQSASPTAIRKHENEIDGAETGMSEQICPESNDDDSSMYPRGFPQVLRAGNYTSESSHPYLSKDIWAELVDNKRTFFLRPYEDGFPNMTTLREWIASRPHPITIVMNNYMDMSFPPSPSKMRNKVIPKEEEDQIISEFMIILNETNLHALYVENYQRSHPPITIEHPKIKRLPIGHKWQFRNTWLYGESKTRQKELYTSISSSPKETKALFEENRTSTVWLKPNFETNFDLIIKYYRDISTTVRQNVVEYCGRRLFRARKTKVCSDEQRPMNQTQTFEELKKHRFCLSPTGVSFDTHFTWDALLAGCIPIVPKTVLEPMFDDLPVWFVNDWKEVTDYAVGKKAIEFASKSDSYNWDKLFADWWKDEIHSGLCKLQNGSGNERTTSFDPLPVLEYEPKVVEQAAIQIGEHHQIPSPEERIGPDGEGGYVHDPGFMRKNPKAFKVIDHEVSCPPPGQGSEKLPGYYALERIRHYMEERGHINRNDEKKGDGPKPKLMCAVYTYEGSVNQTNAIWETWGKRCDGVLFASSISNLTTGHVHMPNVALAQHSYNGVFQKVRSMMAYLYDNFLEDYDYFHFLGDDTYLLVDNLKDFLASPEVQSFEEEKPDNLMLAGEWLCWGNLGNSPRYEYYMGGGSGYTMSRKALKAFAEGPLQDRKYGSGKYLRSSDEDMIISDMFREHFNVTGMDTRDEYGAHRYHQVKANNVAMWPDGGDANGVRFLIFRQSLQWMEFWKGFPQVYKDDLVSSSSIAFHQIDQHVMRRYEMLLYGTEIDQCGKNMTLIP